MYVPPEGPGVVPSWVMQHLLTTDDKNPMSGLGVRVRNFWRPMPSKSPLTRPFEASGGKDGNGPRQSAHGGRPAAGGEPPPAQASSDGELALAVEVHRHRRALGELALQEGQG